MDVDLRTGDVVAAVSFFASPWLCRLDGGTLVEKTRTLLRDVGAARLLPNGDAAVAGTSRDVISVVDRKGGVKTFGLPVAVSPVAMTGVEGKGLLVGTQAGGLVRFEAASGKSVNLAGDAETTLADLRGMRTPTSFLKPVDRAWMFRGYGKWLNTFVEPQREDSIHGIDVVSEQTRPVRAAAEGIVTFAGWKSDEVGQAVVIEHAGGWQTRYEHLHRVPCVTSGQAVKAGDMIGRLGDTGITCLGIDLYFEIRQDQTPVDPVPLFEDGLAGWLKVTDRNNSTMIRNRGFEGAWPDEALRGIPKQYWENCFLEPELSIQGRQSFRFGGVVKSPGPGLQFANRSVRPYTWYVVDEWRHRPPRTMLLCNLVERSFGFPTSRTYGQNLHGYNHGWASTFPTPGILGNIAMAGENVPRHAAGNTTDIRSGVWLERRGDWYHFRSTPMWTSGGDWFGYSMAGDSAGMPDEGARLMMEEGQQARNIRYFTVDEYGRLECDVIQNKRAE
jgi:hypothetical protein